MSDAKERVAVLGASNKTERYSNQAVRLLLEYAHQVIPVHPALNSIENSPVWANLDDIPGIFNTNSSDVCCENRQIHVY